MRRFRSAVLALAVVAVPHVASANLVARWSFDEESGGNTATDDVSGIVATLSGGASIGSDDGIRGGALDLSAETPGFANADDHLAFNGSERFSVQVWVKTTRSTGALVVGRHVSTVVAGYWLGLNDTGDGGPNEPEGSFHLYQSDVPPLNSGAVGINDGQWHQLVAVRDTSRNQIRLYLDGERVPTPTSTGEIHSLAVTPAPFLIGGIVIGDTPTSAYDGLIDEVRVWDTALSDDDVKFFFQHPDSFNKVLCGDSSRNGTLLASDAQGALRAAVGSASCLACICDVNGTGGITASDALLILKKAVGQDVVLNCPVCIAGDLIGLRWEIPCKSSINDHVCSCDNDFVGSAELLGEPGVTYNATLRFRGVVEQHTYNGGVQDGLFLTGGTPTGDAYNVYKLEISDPPGVYYLNAGASFIERCWLLDVTKTIPIKSGATISLEGHAFDLAEIKNRDDSSQPIIPEGVPPAPDPYDGQFIQMDVLEIEEAP